LKINPVPKKGAGFSFKGKMKMPTITIDNKEYEADDLSENAKAQLISINFVDGELQRLNAQAAVLQTARVAYAKALNEELDVKPTVN
jgi:hypothetical protein